MWTEMKSPRKAVRGWKVSLGNNNIVSTTALIHRLPQGENEGWFTDLQINMGKAELKIYFSDLDLAGVFEDYVNSKI